MNNFFTIIGIIGIGLVLVAFSPNESGYKEHSVEVLMNEKYKTTVTLKKVKLDGTICIIAKDVQSNANVALSCDWGK